jgi:hypothetical protein
MVRNRNSTGKKMIQLPKKITRKWAILVLIMFSIIIMGFSIWAHVRNLSNVELSIIANSDRKIAYLGESINFSAEDSKGDINKFFWNFGDGNFSNEKITSHIYDKVGWYIVSLEIFGKKSRMNTSLRIGIQRNNETQIDSNGRSRSGDFVSAEVVIGPNIGNPNVTISVVADNAIGILNFEIALGIEDNQTGTIHWTILHQETLLATGSIMKDFIIKSTELPGGIMNSSSIIQGNLYIQNGRWRSAASTVTCFFN